MKTLVWFRNDLRVEDHPALYHACRQGTVAAVFLVAEKQWRSHDVGDNRLAFLLASLRELGLALARLGIPLHVLPAPWFADAPRVLVELAHSIGAEHLAFGEEYPLNERVRDSHVINACAANGLQTHVHEGSAILPPGTVLTGAGDPYTVFTPFKRRWQSLITPAALTPLPAPAAQAAPLPPPLLPEDFDGIATTTPVDRYWPAGAGEARRRLEHFVASAIQDYDTQRDFPDQPGTSQLSAWLAVGAISARVCLHRAVTANAGRLSGGNPGIENWISELVWRDFYRHVIAQFPHVSRGQAFRPDMDRVPWRRVPDELARWQAGETGYPLVDAAMRQLRTMGWMHNRLRMLTAMFLTKHLLIDWREGERYFMQQLVDGDFAANNGGWQWSASTGTDAAPYFRIFNPVTQAKRFDADGRFVRSFVPELAHLSSKALLEPARHGVPGYPQPMVEHTFARARALETYQAARE